MQFYIRLAMLLIYTESSGIPGNACRLSCKSRSASLSRSVCEKLMPLPANESAFSLCRTDLCVP